MRATTIVLSAAMFAHGFGAAGLAQESSQSASTATPIISDGSAPQQSTNPKKKPPKVASIGTPAAKALRKLPKSVGMYSSGNADAPIVDPEGPTGTEAPSASKVDLLKRKNVMKDSKAAGRASALSLELKWSANNNQQFSNWSPEHLFDNGEPGNAVQGGIKLGF